MTITPEQKEPEKKESTPPSTIPAEPTVGLFTPYKEDQGRHVRMAAFWTVIFFVGFGCRFLHDILIQWPSLREPLGGWRIPVVFITGHGDIPMAVEAMRKGALDFIEKPFDNQLLLNRVTEALEGTQAVRGAAAVRERLEQLSSREREVLQRVLDGKPSRQVADELSISVKTVEFHRARIMHKLGVRSTAQLFRACLGRT